MVPFLKCNADLASWLYGFFGRQAKGEQTDGENGRKC